MKNLDQKMTGLSASRRKKIESRAAELIAEEMTLQELRHARKVTQVQLAKELGIRQEGVSRLEKRSDLLLSTLRKTVKAMGGELRLFAAFPDREPVMLSGIADVCGADVLSRRKKQTSQNGPMRRNHAHDRRG